MQKPSASHSALGSLLRALCQATITIVALILVNVGAAGVDAKEPAIIKTVRGEGYVFAVPVEVSK